mgnify:CR=1 FL=1
MHVSTPDQDARLVAEVERYPFLSPAPLMANTGFPGHVQTVRNRLRSRRLRSRWALSKGILREEHSDERLVFAVEKTDFDWTRIIFSDGLFFTCQLWASSGFIVFLEPN